MLSYAFMQRAFIGAILIALAAPCIGVVLVLKRLSGIGDSASHSALGGVAFGLAFGINPLVGAIIFSILAMLGIEGFRKAFSKYSEIAATVVMAAGIGLTALFSGLISSTATSLNSFMFGSIAAISNLEIVITVVLSAVVLLISILLYKQLFAITFDEENARLVGIRIDLVNFVFMILTALLVSAASRIVGALMISSLMVIPVACSMIVSKSYKGTFAWSIVFAELFTIVGLVISFYAPTDLRPGGTIVVFGVIVLIFILLIKKLFKL